MGFTHPRFVLALYERLDSTSLASGAAVQPTGVLSLNRGATLLRLVRLYYFGTEFLVDRRI